MPEILGEYVDRAVNIEMRFGAGLPRDATRKLYDAARAHHGKPLTWLAAKSLQERIKRGDHVLVVTGAGSWPWLPKGETDGPLGAAAIARALDFGLGAKCVVLAEERNLPPVVACVEAAGLVSADRKLFDARTGAAFIQAFPLGLEAGRAYARQIVDEFKPTAMVFVEKAGPNQHGIFHSILGTGRGDELMANAHCLVEIAKAEGILTVGIGDGGNEIGFGNAVDAVREIQPFGRMCKCPCQGGVATIVGTDVLVSAAVSNWGAYGIAAMIALLVKDPEVLHDTDTEYRMLVDCVRAGGMDGAVARLVPLVDGTSQAVQTSLITILHEIIGNGLKSFTRPF